MEKVIVVRGNYDWLTQDDVHSVNEHLNNGWSVKSVTMQASRDHMVAIFVLSK